MNPNTLNTNTPNTPSDEYSENIHSNERKAGVDQSVPSFGHLGTPRAYNPDEVVGNIRASENSNDPRIMAIQNANQPKPYKPSYSFKLIKTDTINPSRFAHIKWAIIMIIVAIIIVISVAASVTQGIFLVRDRLFSPKNATAINTDNTVKSLGVLENNSGKVSVDSSAEGQVLPLGEERVLGSDDGQMIAEGLDFQPLYKVANADTISNLGITAKGFYVADIKSGERIVQKNADEVFPIASVSKLMTGVVAYEAMDPQKVVVVSRDSYNTYGAQGELLPGEKIKLGDLMYPLLMESSNDAAEVIAESYGHTEFISLMNKKAALLGMNDTYYEDPSGLNAKNSSSASDMFRLLKYIKDKSPILLDMTRVRQFEILKHRWYNKNQLLNSDYFIGGKNGYIDESRWTTASLFDVVLAKGGRRQIGIILLKSENREGDVNKLIKFMEKNVYYKETVNFFLVFILKK